MRSVRAAMVAAVKRVLLVMYLIWKIARMKIWPAKAMRAPREKVRSSAENVREREKREKRKEKRDGERRIKNIGQVRSKNKAKALGQRIDFKSKSRKGPNIRGSGAVR